MLLGGWRGQGRTLHLRLRPAAPSSAAALASPADLPLASIACHALQEELSDDVKAALAAALGAWLPRCAGLPAPALARMAGAFGMLCAALGNLQPRSSLLDLPAHPVPPPPLLQPQRLSRRRRRCGGRTCARWQPRCVATQRRGARPPSWRRRWASSCWRAAPRRQVRGERTTHTTRLAVAGDSRGGWGLAGQGGGGGSSAATWAERRLPSAPHTACLLHVPHAPALWCPCACSPPGRPAGPHLGRLHCFSRSEGR